MLKYASDSVFLGINKIPNPIQWLYWFVFMWSIVCKILIFIYKLIQSLARTVFFIRCPLTLVEHSLSIVYFRKIGLSYALPSWDLMSST